MELESETKVGLSAVERLAMSKPKYVKSQQVVNSTQEPVINFGSLSVSSTGSSNHSLKQGGKLVSNLAVTKSSGPSPSCSPGQVRRSSSKNRPDSLLLHRQKCDLLKASAIVRRHPLVRRLQHKMTVAESDRKSESRSHQERIPTQFLTIQKSSEGLAKESAAPTLTSAPDTPNTLQTLTVFSSTAAWTGISLTR